MKRFWNVCVRSGFLGKKGRDGGINGKKWEEKRDLRTLLWTLSWENEILHPGSERVKDVTWNDGISSKNEWYYWPWHVRHEKFKFVQGHCYIYYVWLSMSLALGFHVVLNEEYFWFTSGSRADDCLVRLLVNSAGVVSKAFRYCFCWV